MLLFAMMAGCTGSGSPEPLLPRPRRQPAKGVCYNACQQSARSTAKKAKAAAMSALCGEHKTLREACDHYDAPCTNARYWRNELQKEIDAARTDTYRMATTLLPEHRLEFDVPLPAKVHSRAPHVASKGPKKKRKRIEGDSDSVRQLKRNIAFVAAGDAIRDAARLNRTISKRDAARAGFEASGGESGGGVLLSDTTAWRAGKLPASEPDAPPLGRPSKCPKWLDTFVVSCLLELRELQVPTDSYMTRCVAARSQLTFRSSPFAAHLS